MNTATLSHRAASRIRSSYGFRTVAQMEWRKLRTVRSTWYIVAVFAAGMIGLAIVVLPAKPLDPEHGAEVPARPDEEFADCGQAGRAHAVARSDLRLAVRVCDGCARGRGLGDRPP